LTAIDLIKLWTEDRQAHLNPNGFVHDYPHVEHTPDYMKVAEIEPVSVPVTFVDDCELRTEIPSFDPIRTNGSGFHPEIPSPVLTQEQTEQVAEATVLGIEPKKFTLDSVKKVLPALRKAKNSIIAAGNKVSDASTATYAWSYNSVHNVGNSITAPENSRTRKIVAGAGALMVAGAGIYLAYKGFSHSGSSGTTHETLANATPKNSPVHAAEAVKPAASSHIKTVVKHLPNLRQTFTIEPNHGFTQELQQLFQSKHEKLSSGKSYQLYKALREHFGDHGLLRHGHSLTDGTYSQNGDLFISNPGKAQWAQGVTKFAQNWFSRNG